MKPHRIRLAGPWEWRPLAENEGVAGTGEPQKCQLPFPSEANVVVAHGLVLRRRFHCPTGIGPGTTIAVILETLHGAPEAWLNEKNLTAVESDALKEEASRDIANQWRFEISALLKPYNDLQVRLIPSLPDCLPTLCAAALEIREPK